MDAADDAPWSALDLYTIAHIIPVEDWSLVNDNSSPVLCFTGHCRLLWHNSRLWAILSDDFWQMLGFCRVKYEDLPSGRLSSDVLTGNNVHEE